MLYAAARLEQNYERRPKAIATASRGKARYCYSSHVLPDCQAPEIIDEPIRVEDADGLDRVRLGDLGPAYLRTERAHTRVDAAHDLMRVTLLRPGDDSWSAVQAEAIEFGDWR